ncbi:MAG: rhodanese-like domain-containing protein [Anaerolineae bacterium]
MPVQDLTIEQYRAEFEGQQTYQLIDVREIAEFEEVRIPDTVNIPLSELQTRVSEISQDTPVVLVCRSGGRSQMAGDMLVASGYSNVYNLLEGTLGWVKRDLPTEAGE